MKPRTLLLLTAGSLLGLSLLVAMASARAEAQPETETYKVDPVHSTVVFRIKHLGVSYFYGRFNGPFGEFSFNPQNPDECSFEITIRTQNVDTNNPNRDGHLKSADFFNAKQFPKITFKSKEVKKVSDDTFRVTGDLALHGVTRPVTIDLKHVGSGKGMRSEYRRGFEATFTIKRSDYGMKFMLGGLGDEVTLMVGIEGIRQ